MSDDKKNGNEELTFTVPAWINAELIQKALDNEGENNLKVKRVTVEPATAPGDNYASTIYRVKAALSDGSHRPLLVKVLPPGTVMALWITEWGMFEREGLLLGDLIPKMEALLEAAAPGRYAPLAARCPLHGDSPAQFLVLEDLAPSGFRLADRKRGLGLRHSIHTVHALARFHAASHALLRREPLLVGSLTNERHKVYDEMRASSQASFDKMAEYFRTSPGLEQYADVLEKVKVSGGDYILKLKAPKPGAFNVIIHGDFWANNMMFRYEDGLPADFRFIDFQLSMVSSPTWDLHHFLSTSVNENVSTHYEDLLVREYYFTLKDTLEVLGLEAPSYETFLADMDTHGAVAFWMAINVVPVLKAEKHHDHEVSAIKDPDCNNHLFESPLVKRWLQRVIPKYVQKGWVPAV